MNNDLLHKANSSTLTNYLPKSNGITSLTMNGSSLQLHKGNGTTSRINLNNTSAIKSKNAGTADYATNSGTATRANYATNSGTATYANFANILDALTVTSISASNAATRCLLSRLADYSGHGDVLFILGFTEAAGSVGTPIYAQVLSYSNLPTTKSYAPYIFSQSSGAGTCRVQVWKEIVANSDQYLCCSGYIYNIVWIASKP